MAEVVVNCEVMGTVAAVAAAVVAALEAVTLAIGGECELSVFVSSE